MDLQTGSQKEIKMGQKKKLKIMEKMNQIDFPRFIQTQDKTINKPLNNFDNISVYLKLEEIKRNPEVDKKVYCGFEKITIDLETFTVKYHVKTPDLPENETFYLVRSETGKRIRPDNSLRYQGNEMCLDKDLTDKYGEYGELWVDKCNNR